MLPKSTQLAPLGIVREKVHAWRCWLGCRLAQVVIGGGEVNQDVLEPLPLSVDVNQLGCATETAGLR